MPTSAACRRSSACPPRILRTATRSSTGSFVTIDTFYDALGRTQHVTLPYFGALVTTGDPRDSARAKTRFEYDALDRKTKTVTPDGGITTVEYDRGKITTTDPKLRKRIQLTDANGRIIEVQELVGTSTLRTQYTHDSGTGELIKIIDAKNNVFAFEYRAQADQRVWRVVRLRCFGQSDLARRGSVRVRRARPDEGRDGR
jgi:YD repeat-containing protein